VTRTRTRNLVLCTAIVGAALALARCSSEDQPPTPQRDDDAAAADGDAALLAATEPTQAPTYRPTSLPTSTPTGAPTGQPSTMPTPTAQPTPSTCPTDAANARDALGIETATEAPTYEPTELPTMEPTAPPSTCPTMLPTSPSDEAPAAASGRMFSPFASIATNPFAQVLLCGATCKPGWSGPGAFPSAGGAVNQVCCAPGTHLVTSHPGGCIPDPNAPQPMCSQESKGKPSMLADRTKCCVQAHNEFGSGCGSCCAGAFTNVVQQDQCAAACRVTTCSAP
jgi:hypothetical protein